MCRYHNKSILSCLLIVVIAICLVLIMISGSVISIVDMNILYEYGFNKYRISEITDISSEQLQIAGETLRDYLSGRIESPQMQVSDSNRSFELYNGKELVHLSDVRNIIEIVKYVLMISGLILLCCIVIAVLIEQPVRVLTGFICGSSATIILTILLVIWITIDFEGIFYLFHIVSFDNDLWLLDPSKDYLIKMFPQGFFNDASIFLEGFIILFAMTILVIMVSLRRSIGGQKKIDASFCLL